MANSSPRYRNSNPADDQNDRHFYALMKQERQRQPHQDWQTLPQSDQVSYYPSQFESETSPDNGSPRWGENYIATATSQPPVSSGYQLYDPPLADDPIDTAPPHNQIHNYGPYSDATFNTTLATTQPDYRYDPSSNVAENWQSDPISVGYSHVDDPSILSTIDPNSTSYHNGGNYDDQLGMVPDETIGSQGHVTLSPHTPNNHHHGGLHAPAHVQLHDRPYSHLYTDDPIPYIPPQPKPKRSQHTKETIMEYFRNNYAAKRNELPPYIAELPDVNSNIWCRYCDEPIPAFDYLDHKEMVHGVNRKTNYHYAPPMDIRLLDGPFGPGLGASFEGYCATCGIWMPLDLNIDGFNWFQHACSCQEPQVAAMKSLTPMERFSSNEDEPDDVKDAARKHRLISPFLTEGWTQHPQVGSDSSVSWTSVSSDGSGKSAHSGSSAKSALSHISNQSLAGRRKNALRFRPRKGAKDPNARSRVYQCTFCKADFVSFGDWRRHEENIHLVLSKWVCAPDGMYKPGTQECVYCETVHGNDRHGINRCNAGYCHAKEPADRVFARKDHLKQHLKKIHGVQWRASFEQWSIKTQGPTKSRCGFCDLKFSTWQQRMQHIGYEFKSGQRMAFWQGDWGLDNYWMTEDRLGGVIKPEDRDDHKSKQTLPRSNASTGSRRSSIYNPVRVAKTSGQRGALHQKARGPGLKHKPRFTSLREGADGAPSSVDYDAEYEVEYEDHVKQEQHSMSPELPEPHDEIFQALTPPDSEAQMDSSPVQAATAAAKASEPSFACFFCRKRYTRQDNLRRHIRTHHSPSAE